MPEFYFFVAQNIGVGCHTARVIRDHRFDHFLLVFIRKVYLTERNAERRRHAQGIEPIRRPRAFDEFGLPNLYERADDVVPLIL